MLDAEERRWHLYILGQTGTGKSTTLLNLVCQDSSVRARFFGGLLSGNYDFKTPNERDRPRGRSLLTRSNTRP